VESALPPVQYPDEAGISPRQTPLPSTSINFGRERDLYHEHLHQSSITPIGPSDADHWTVGPKPWQQQPAYTPSPEHQIPNLVPHDGRSISTTNLSSNTAGKSTPESQKTSNTSYHESENQVHQPRDSKEGNDSFYWHSGRSSSDAEDNHSNGGSPTATPGKRSTATTSSIQPREHQGLPPRSTSLSPDISAPYGASALGFGGPSDWEYFGDYEAEEIDDEELYSRPRLQDRTSVKEGSAELPADPAPENDLQDCNEPVPNSRPLAPEISPARQPDVENSQDDMAQGIKTITKSEYGSEGKSVPVQSPNDVTSIDASFPSNVSPVHRPDLDEVILACSVTPYVGLVQDEAVTSLSNGDSNLGPPDVAEASLASTPRERMFGVDVILKHAPSMPKLPASLDHFNAHDDQFKQGHEASKSPMEPTLTPKNSGVQLLPSLGQSHSFDVDLTEITQFIPSSEATHHPDQRGSGPLSQSIAPVAVDMTAETIETTSTKPLDTAPSGPATGIHPFDEAAIARVEYRPATPQATLATSKTAGTISKPIKNSSVLQRVKELEKKKSDASFHAKSRDSTVEDKAQGSQRTSRITTPEISGVSTPQEDGHFDIWKSFEEATPSKLDPIVSMVPRESSQEDVLEASGGPIDKDTVFEASSKLSDPVPQDRLYVGQPEAFQDPEQNDPLEKTREVARETLIGGVENEHALEPSQEHSNKNLNTLHTDGTADVPRAETDDTARLSQQNIPPTSSTSHAPDQASLPKADKATDPYADMDPWGKASLNRFAAMLREESRAESNKDKLNIFNVFTSRESRLRVVLYGTEDDLIIPPKPAEQTPEARPETQKDGPVKPTVQRTNTVNLQRSLKALPALPANRESVIGLPTTSLAPLMIEHTPISRAEAGSLTEPYREDSYVMGESPSAGPQYSPGGRPIIHRLSGQNQNGLHDPVDDAASSDVIENFGSIRPSDSTISDAVEPEKSAYPHAKHNDGRSEVKNYLANRKSVLRPYATLTQGSLDSGSTFGKESDIKLPHVPIMAPTSQYNLSSQGRGDEPSEVTIKSKAPRAEAPSDSRRFVKADFDPLLTVLPESEAIVYESPRLEDLKDVIEAIPDDFSFIHQSVVSWDAKARKQREENDRQRHARQVESEQRIDSLFDDHEIGYGDISELEAEFKQSEAARRADEDRSEYQTFVAEVFNVVWTRLHYEQDQLIPHYEQYSKLLNHTLAGKDMFEDSEDGLPLAPTMSAFLGLHQKLEIRHQKAFEAVLERDRRLKKTEMAPWYTLSNIAKVKQLEKQFEDAEKKAIIEYCQQRDTRANRLMDVLDQNTLRGVGANQDYMEAIMKAVRRIASGRAFASVACSNEPTAGMEEVEKAQTITGLLATSSEQIVQTFHVADMLLNSANYEVSVAKAKVSKADMATLVKLKEERAKEDQKLMRDLEHRLALIREDSRRTNDEIVKLMLFLGVQNGRADSAPAQAGPADPEHEARIQKALEEAKIRNALKESSM